MGWALVACVVRIGVQRRQSDFLRLELSRLAEQRQLAPSPESVTRWHLPMAMLENFFSRAFGIWPDDSVRNGRKRMDPTIVSGRCAVVC